VTAAGSGAQVTWETGGVPRSTSGTPEFIAIMMVVVAVALFMAVRLTARRWANIPQVGEGVARRPGLTSPT
jgi:hypothetical protein